MSMLEDLIYKWLMPPELNSNDASMQMLSGGMTYKDKTSEKFSEIEEYIRSLIESIRGKPEDRKEYSPEPSIGIKKPAEAGKPSTYQQPNFDIIAPPGDEQPLGSKFYIAGGDEAPQERERTPEELLESLYQRLKPQNEIYFNVPNRPGSVGLAHRQNVNPEQEMEAKKTAAILLGSMLQDRENRRATEAQERVAGITGSNKTDKQLFDMDMSWRNMVNSQVKLYADRASEMMKSGSMINQNQFNEALSGYQDALVSGDQELAIKWKQRLDDILSGKIGAASSDSPLESFKRFTGIALGKR